MYTAHLTAAIVMTLSVLEGHSHVASLFKYNIFALVCFYFQIYLYCYMYV